MGGTTFFAAGGAFDLAPLAAGSWTAIVLEVVFGASVKLTMNGATIPLAVDAGAVPTPSTILFAIGAARSAPGGVRLRVLYDDVRCDVLH